jgi:hypothetical protein
MDTTRKFTVEAGLQVQANNLIRWKSILKPAKYLKLAAHIAKVNADAHYKSGTDVLRGNDIDVWVANNLMVGGSGYLKKVAPKTLYQVELCRTGYGFVTIEVEARSQGHANDIALDEADNYEYTEKTSEYSIAH